MTEVEERFAELELRYISQQDLIEQLNEELVKANRTIDALEKRVVRLETTVDGLTRAVDVPANEKPPHY
jgi:SlyX protein